MHASRDGVPVRLVSTLSLSHLRLELSPTNPFASEGGAGDTDDPFFVGDEPDILAFFAFSASTVFLHFETISVASRAISLFGFARCFATTIPALVA
jgi:hypothetical protein